MHMNSTLFRHWYQQHLALYSNMDREKTRFIQSTGSGIVLKSKLNSPTALSQITLAATAFSCLKKYSSCGFLSGFRLSVCFCINSDYRQTSRGLYPQQVPTIRAEEVSSVTVWIPPPPSLTSHITMSKTVAAISSIALR